MSLKHSEHSYYAFACTDLLTVTENQMILTNWCIGRNPYRKQKRSKKLGREQLKFVTLSFETLRAHDCKYRESLARLKKIENSDNLSEKPLWRTVFEKNIFNFQESIVFEKMRKNENSGFYLINYAKIRVKMTYFIASVPKQDSKL